MRERHAGRQRCRAQEFEAFVAGAAGRLLHTATLLTAEPADPPGANPRAQRLLTASLARTFADWERLRGEDPYDRTRQELAARFARASWRHHRPRGGLLDRLTPQERLVLVLRLYEGVSEEQTAALLGLGRQQVRAVCNRAVATMRGTRGPTGRRGPARLLGAGP
ncbi:sigma factor-like helix-turn-helix DNA-binding protein [Streptomyces castrisilvae]|uniref:Sigma factor-like helix-turn-helix DNA-binding protein n=1 Tax=Streptomyces castrisilvae TaxID=3033811 RepID=A0ABY9HN16_9ACTN|nr:sigma factor-like helix-turn-helix DNA-binding protein [Streptomyces sp. Mut1]WLQ35927.1 sigma factor-like helix-turn-helix DNA-binding protein [Streptomyces sp. Mut1]